MTVDENEPTPVYDETRDKYKGGFTYVEKPKLTLKEKVAKVLTPNVRRWAYGITAAAITAGATWAGKPEFIPVAIPLAIAVWYVTPEGEPR